MPRVKPPTAAEKAAAGFCTACGYRPPAPNRRLCPECLQYCRDSWREKSAARKAKGLCARCGKQPARPERTECADCAARTAGRFNAKNADYVRKRYWSRIKAGLCAKCGKAKPLPGRRNCASCADKAYRSERDRKAARRSQGLCVDCGTAAQGGYMTCERCRARHRHNAAKLYATPVWEPGFTVYVLATGECLGTFDSREDVALCLAFAKLDREAVEIVTDAPALVGLVGWS